MKKSIILTVFASFALLFAGCGSDNETPTIQFTGEWHLVQWNGTAPTEFDAYVAFNADRTFALYQRIERVEYQLFTGLWSYNGKLLTGIYDDETLWGSDYEVTLDETLNMLTLTSPTAGEVSIYQRTAIPEAIKSSAQPAIDSRAEIIRLF